ncbi:hypothetical protein [Cupriavidus pampae]|uniref:Uncharacterized protein n=1 Tax=Cupriavidus pampae TaxID=659251 RepID=A0ABN7ZGB0_9BURK|nr:hypothetical protein [Cupriavidus pampae]CAG9183325.1 hypothetical protein LMG32289_05345 [Cupriavidus pampae]
MAITKTGLAISAMLMLAANAQASALRAPQDPQSVVDLKWGHCEPFYETGATSEMLSMFGCN